ncbi:NAD(P)-dependent oxidoreductase [Amylibacter sp.]|nr:NAD(P)-dependent oxidoreductase [Amylibacter sp.]MDB2537306.1 NAD(P)-dependent oxidoreductase [Amylibacter sp.]MDC1041469.1 NAD(P)-dependent oxidoreductase [Amylibacter sp.]
MARKITLIGGSGFVGTNLCRLLALEQQDFEIIDLKMSREFPEKCKIGDVRNLESLREVITGDVVVNLAAVHRDDVRERSEYQKTNIDGAKNVAQICTEKEINKIIFTSTVAVYGHAEPGTNEGGAIKPFNEYGRTKFEAEEHLRAWQSCTAKSLIIIRPTVIFGEGNRGNVYNLLNQIASNRFVMVGSGENKKSIAYIGNVVAFLATCISTDQKYGLYNYVDTPDFTMNELVSEVRNKLKQKQGVGLRLPYLCGVLIGYIADGLAKLIGRNLPVSSIRIKKFVASTEFVSSSATLDDFIPPFHLSEGLERTLNSEFVSPDPKREVFFTE